MKQRERSAPGLFFFIFRAGFLDGSVDRAGNGALNEPSWLGAE
jgi:hypothetical protein